MKLTEFSFCKDKQGHFGLVREYANSMLLVTFDFGTIWVSPYELTFV